MSKTKVPGWRPVTMTIADDVADEIRSRASREGREMGRVATSALRQAFGLHDEEEQRALAKRLEALIDRSTRPVALSFISKGLSALSGEEIAGAQVRRWMSKEAVPQEMVAWVRTFLAVADALPIQWSNQPPEEA